MPSILKFTLKNFMLIISPALLLLPVLSENVQAQTCFLEICKMAEGAGDTGFSFNVDGGDIPTFELFDGGDCITESFDPSQDLAITEEPVTGWVLEDVVCKTAGGIEFQDIHGGIIASCTTEKEASAGCTFVNAQFVSNIPTLSEWGMISVAAGLGMIGVFFAARRRRAVVNS